MNSFLKGIGHTVLSVIGIYLPVIVSSNPVFHLTVGFVLTAGFNWIFSHFVPTTTGASAQQTT